MAIRSILAMLTAVCMPVTAAHAERRALVIGNAEYKSGNLEQPKRDARDVARALAALGFRVDVELNLRSTPMEKTVARFSRSLAPADVVFFYYAGHGMEIAGQNILLPVDFDAPSTKAALNQGYRVSELLAAVKPPQGSAVVVLDACRDNPYTSRSMNSKATRGLAPAASRGFKVVNNPVGSYVAFSTAPGQTARNTAERNSPFTTSLLNHMAEPGVDVNDLFRRVRADVLAFTGNGQNPWSNDNLTGRLYLNPSMAVSAEGAPAPANAVRDQADIQATNQVAGIPQSETPSGTALGAGLDTVVTPVGVVAGLGLCLTFERHHCLRASIYGGEQFDNPDLGVIGSKIMVTNLGYRYIFSGLPLNTGYFEAILVGTAPKADGVQNAYGPVGTGGYQWNWRNFGIGGGVMGGVLFSNVVTPFAGGIVSAEARVWL